MDTHTPTHTHLCPFNAFCINPTSLSSYSVWKGQISSLLTSNLPQLYIFGVCEWPWNLMTGVQLEQLTQTSAFGPLWRNVLKKSMSSREDNPRGLKRTRIWEWRDHTVNKVHFLGLKYNQLESKIVSRRHGKSLQIVQWIRLEVLLSSRLRAQRWNKVVMIMMFILTVAMRQLPYKGNM